MPIIFTEYYIFHKIISEKLVDDIHKFAPDSCAEDKWDNGRNMIFFVNISKNWYLYMFAEATKLARNFWLELGKYGRGKILPKTRDRDN